MGRSLCGFKSQRKWVVPFSNLRWNPSTPPLEYSQSKAILPIKEKFCKGGIVGSSLKSATWLSLPCTRRWSPCDTWHSSFHPDGNHRSLHPDISHPEFCLTDIPLSPDISQPPFCPTDVPPHLGISHSDPADVPPSPDISHPMDAAGWERRTIQLHRADMSGSFGNAYPENIRGQRFRFPRYLGLSNTRNSPDPFSPTIKKITLTTLTTKSPELSLIFHAR